MAVNDTIGHVFNCDRRVFLGGPADHVRNRDGKWKDIHHST